MINDLNERTWAALASANFLANCKTDSGRLTLQLFTTGVAEPVS